jgi:hypothetical protein
MLLRPYPVSEHAEDPNEGYQIGRLPKQRGGGNLPCYNVCMLSAPCFPDSRCRTHRTSRESIFSRKHAHVTCMSSLVESMVFQV